MENVQILETHVKGNPKMAAVFDEHDQVVEVRYYHSNGKIKKSLPLKDLVPTGITKEWDHNGTLRTAMQFYSTKSEHSAAFDTKIKGVVKHWDEFGNPMQLYRVDQNQRHHGICTLYNQLGNPMSSHLMIQNKIVIDFIKNPGLYPQTPQDLMLLNLQYGIDLEWYDTHMDD